MEKGLISGSSALLVLQLLSEKDMYGYEMIETLKKRSNQVFSMHTGTLYPLMHTLELKGYVNSYDGKETAKPRKYYSLTDKGRHILAEKCSEWKVFKKAMESIVEGGK